jgi:hypothetical protein
VIYYRGQFWLEIVHCTKISSQLLESVANLSYKIGCPKEGGISDQVPDLQGQRLLRDVSLREGLLAIDLPQL